MSTRVTDYSLAQGDVLDVSALVDGNFTAGSQIVDFVRLIASGNGNDLVLQVDPNGSADNPHAWENVAILDNADVVRGEPGHSRFCRRRSYDHADDRFHRADRAKRRHSARRPAPSVKALLVTVTDHHERGGSGRDGLMVPRRSGSNDGGVAIFDAANSTSTALVFDYTVLAGQSTPTWQHRPPV